MKDKVKNNFNNAELSDPEITGIDSYKFKLKQLEIDNKIINLLHLRPYTIDDISTFEIDDAISLEKKGSQKTIWIHISDPSSFISSNSNIDLKAKRKATSVYLSNEVITMLPNDLIHNHFSLRAGRKVSTLSAAINIGSEGEILGFNVMRALIRPVYNLTYEEANELIDYAPREEDDLYILSTLLDLRRRWRMNQGALLLDQPHGRLTLKQDKPSLNIIEPSPARILVSECMILMGTVIAEYGQNRSIPLPFRSQVSSLKSRIKYTYDNKILAVNNSIIKQNLYRAITSVEPNRHFSLGLKCYTQATSPLRRYTDLIVHRQILGHLDNNTFLNVNDVSELLMTLLTPQKQALDLMREDQANLQYIYFEYNKDKIWKTYFLRIISQKEGIVLLYFELLEMDIVCNLGINENWTTGDCINITVDHLDKQSNTVFFEIATPSN